MVQIHYIKNTNKFRNKQTKNKIKAKNNKFQNNLLNNINNKLKIIMQMDNINKLILKISLVHRK
jgi:hypothetical protein